MRGKRNCEGFSEDSYWKSVVSFKNQHIQEKENSHFLSTSMVKLMDELNLFTIESKIEGFVLERRTRLSYTCLN